MKFLKRKIEIMPGEFITYTFEWDDSKSDSNSTKHKINFEDAVTMFVEQFNGTLQSDNKIVYGEERQQIELKDKNNKKWRMIFVVNEVDDNGYPEHVIRIISFHRNGK